MSTTTEDPTAPYAAEGLRLRQWRHGHKLSQKELGKHLGVVLLTVQRWETGRRKVPSFLHLALDRLDEILPPPRTARALPLPKVIRESTADPW